MEISLISDEISADPETAIELGSQWGVHNFELRSVFTERVPQLSAFQKQYLQDALEEYQARVVAIGPGLLKIPYQPVRAPRQHLSWIDLANYEEWAEAQRVLHYHLNELLPASLDYACELGAALVIIFGFDRAGIPPGLPPDEVLNYLRQAAERAQAAGLRLALENEAGFWADTGQRSAQIVKMINHPALGLNWDPGNAFCAGDEPYPAGYQFVRGMVQHVHFKDAQRDANGRLQYSNMGQVDWAGQIRALAADGYTGHISIETHLHPKVSSAQASLERLRALIADVHSSQSTSLNE
jgi:sugar phosphate isomerase/epimerase